MVSLNVNVDGSGADVIVTKQFLQSENINATLKQMRGETVSQGVDTGRFLNTGFFLAIRNAR